MGKESDVELGLYMVLGLKMEPSCEIGKVLESRNSKRPRCRTEFILETCRELGLYSELGKTHMLELKFYLEL